MLDMTIPGFGELKINHIMMEFDGTLAQEGSLPDTLTSHLIVLSKQFKLHILTADTFKTAAQELKNIPCELSILPTENETILKTNYLLQLDPDKTIAIGSGRNDQAMLQTARLGIAVLNKGGLALSALSSADILVPDIFSALYLLRDERRLIATLRS